MADIACPRLYDNLAGTGNDHFRPADLSIVQHK